MKVYIGFECIYNGCDVFRNVHCVFTDELQAMEWESQLEQTDSEWREYEEFQTV